jgi:hypothetical protein
MNQQDKDITINALLEHELELDNYNGNDNRKHYKYHKHRSLSPKQKQIEWRRQRVHQLLIMCLNSYEIADALKISSRPTITRDIQQIKETIVNELKYHVTERLPFEFDRCLQNNNLVLKEAWRIVASCENNGDNRTKLQALTLIEQSTNNRINLITNVSVVTESLQQVEKMKQEIQQSSDRS